MKKKIVLLIICALCIVGTCIIFNPPSTSKCAMDEQPPIIHVIHVNV